MKNKKSPARTRTPSFTAEVIFRSGGTFGLAFDSAARMQTFAAAYKKFLKDGSPTFTDAVVASVPQKIDEKIAVNFTDVVGLHYSSNW